ncbi:MAG TPA: molybdopterin-dependent oxidoreductase, partial [Rhizomicrobium sp.]
EKEGLYVNFEGRVQRAERAAFPPGEAKADWTILRALSEQLGYKLPYDDLTALRAAIVKQAPHFAETGKTPVHTDTASSTWSAVGTEGRLERTQALSAAISDYYFTNPIARASETMAKCSQEFVTGPSKMAAE